MSSTTENCADKKSWPYELIAIGLVLTAVLVRCFPWEYIFSDGMVVLPGTDPYYHLWRAEMLVNSFPALATFDAYISFPQGAFIPWPPGFDLLVALPGLLGGGSKITAAWGAILMPLLGGLSVYLVYRLGRGVFDPLTGLLAAGFLALMSGAIGFSFVGRVDHHGLVAPVTLGMYLALLAALEASSKRRSIAWSVVCGLLVAVSVGSWIISPPLYFLPIPLSLAILRWSPEIDKVRRVAWYCLTSTFLFVLLTVLICADLQANPFTLYQPSWFTVILFGLAGVGVIPFLYPGRIFLYVWAGLAGLIAILFAVAPGTLAPLLEAVQIATGDDVSYVIAKESSKMYLQGDLFTLSHSAARYTNLFLLAPFMIGIYLWQFFKTGRFKSGRVLLAVFWPFGLILLLGQERFGEYAAPAVALVFAWSLSQGTKIFIAFYKNAASKIRARLWGALLVAGLAIAVFPLVSSLVLLARTDQVKFRRDFLAYCHDLAGQMPKLKVVDGRPQWGVLTSWNETHPLLLATRLPVVASSFATQDGLRGNRLGFRILLALDEEAAYQELSENRIRFVVVAPIITQVNAMAAMAGLTLKYMKVDTRVESEGYARHYQPLVPFAECLHTRMLVSDGTTMNVSGNKQKPLAHFRLHFESMSATSLFDLKIPQFKTFEVVAGAHLVGVAAPGELVRLRLTIKTNIGRLFTYSREVLAGADGHFSFRVPYSTTPPESAVRALGAYRIKVGSKVSMVDVTEQDVQAGREVSID
jgi:asparagine N-glycosylation enzyme membrane subunit Stt3